jgi:hypothetical protein
MNCEFSAVHYAPKTFSYFKRLTEYLPCMHVYFVSYLLSVVADAARGKRSLLKYFRE